MRLPIIEEEGVDEQIEELDYGIDEEDAEYVPT